MLQNSVKMDISRYSDHWQRYQIKSARWERLRRQFRHASAFL